MSKEIKPRKPRSSTKKSTSELEAKIAELEAKIGQLSSQVKPAEQHARPAPKPRPAASGQTRGTLPAGMAPPPKPKEEPKPSTSSVSSGEVAPAYATTSSTGYTGNKYYATRARLSYHPPDKQYKGEPATQISTSKPSPPPEPQYTYQESSSQQKPKSSSTWKAKGAQIAEEYTLQTQPARHEETRPAPPPAPKPRPAASGPTHGTLPAGMAPPPKPKEVPTPSSTSTEERAVGEVAPAYATISSTGYTGNKYFATRARLSYHPPNKQFKGQSATAQTVQVAPEPPKPKRGTLPAGWKP